MIVMVALPKGGKLPSRGHTRKWAEGGMQDAEEEEEEEEEETSNGDAESAAEDAAAGVAPPVPGAALL